MTTALATIGVLVATISLLFSGWQARLLSRQTALQNATAGAGTMQQLFNWLHDVQGRLLDEPRLLPFFHAGGAAPGDLNPQEQAKLRMLAAMYTDVLTIGVFLHKTMPQTRSQEEWTAFCVRMLECSEPIRAEVAAKPIGYPDLWQIMHDRFPETVLSGATGAQPSDASDPR
ncbi:hypothetical protein [Paractinoplanes atraurantiacus]|uniref:Uncharacterized protein n=1 Tax=Paractinoplanes atraurantiacus TaxID=1036182 RepID=A0A285KQD0_9ACTN|nr:hypothetical protein [Actinoplanes atraurantiacus]SNY74842.1 hypothetical protein SAMN05421748_15335 [Actinoplanes atraurantiacus]